MLWENGKEDVDGRATHRVKPGGEGPPAMTVGPALSRRFAPTSPAKRERCTLWVAPTSPAKRERCTLWVAPTFPRSGRGVLAPIQIQTSFCAVRSPPSWPVFSTPRGSINNILTSRSA
jgi:hypothetical protein